MLVATQIRAARALLGWSQTRLAEAADVGIVTVKRLESGGNSKKQTLDAVEAALKAAGVVFLDIGEPSGGGGSGVRLAR